MEKIHDGNVEIHDSNREEWEKKLQGVTKISGYLHVYGSAKLDAPQLQSVGGYLHVYDSANLDALQLQSVGGDLYVSGSAKLDALQSVGGGLYVSGSAKLDAPQLQSVGGYLHVYDSAKLDALQLQSVGGYLYVSGSANLDALQLQSVGGDLYVSDSAKLDALQLQSVGGDLYVSGSAKLDALQSVGGDLYVSGSAKLDAPQLQSVGGGLSVSGSAKLDALQSVGGDLHVSGKLNEDLEALLWKKYRKNRQWYMADHTSEFLLSKKSKCIEYRIANVVFDRGIFNKVRLGKLSAVQVFAIANAEQRRVAYERMDKAKMADLDGLTVLDEKADPANPLRIVAFRVDGYKEPFRYLHCVCPSTNREYFLETRQTTCDAAVATSFGLERVVFDKEW